MRRVLDDIAIWRPLGNPAEEPSIGKPRLLIWHTMVGYLQSTENMFLRDGFGGTESTFGLGGSWDGPKHDGELRQWQVLDRQADAQWDGNAYGNSIECSDGGDPDRPFTAKQIEKSIILGVTWCRETGNPARPAPAWNGTGFGYHSMFERWNKSRHGCPNPTRIKQLRTVIWPEIARRLDAVTSGGSKPTGTGGVEANIAPKFPLPQGGFYGEPDGKGGAISGFDDPDGSDGIRRYQKQMRNRGWDIDVDGRFGGRTGDVTEAFQREKRLGVDRRVGLQTWNAAWTLKVT